MQWIFWTCFYFNGGKQPIWNIFSRGSLTFVEERYQLILQIWDIFFTSFSFQFVSYVNFIFTEIFICYSDFYFIVRGWTIERNYPVKGKKCFCQDLSTLQIWFLSGKRFSTYGLKNSLPNQDLANGQLRDGFDSRKISKMNIHSRSDLKYVIFNTGTQSVLDL